VHGEFRKGNVENGLGFCMVCDVFSVWAAVYLSPVWRVCNEGTVLTPFRLSFCLSVIINVDVAYLCHWRLETRGWRLDTLGIVSCKLWVC